MPSVICGLSHKASAHFSQKQIGETLVLHRFSAKLRAQFGVFERYLHMAVGPVISCLFEMPARSGSSIVMFDLSNLQPKLTCLPATINFCATSLLYERQKGIDTASEPLALASGSASVSMSR